VDRKETRRDDVDWILVARDMVYRLAPPEPGSRLAF
jgi:hypothetical protein